MCKKKNQKMSTRDEVKEDAINRFLKNLRLLTDTISRVVLHAIENTDILQEDESKCQIRDHKDRITKFNESLHKLGLNTSEIREILTLYTKGIREPEILCDVVNSMRVYPGEIQEILTEIEKISCCRLKPAYNMLRSYRRASHNLDEEGYNWDLFFENEEDEPAAEKDYRMMMTPELRKIFREKAIYLFAKHTYPYLDAIENRELNFLVNHLSSLFPNSELTDRLSVIFCTDDAGNFIPKYINEKDVDFIWRIVQGCVKNGLIYCYSSEVSNFEIKIKVGTHEHPQRNYVINYPKEFTRWKIDSPKF